MGGMGQRSTEQTLSRATLRTVRAVAVFGASLALGMGAVGLVSGSVGIEAIAVANVLALTAVVWISTRAVERTEWRFRRIFESDIMGFFIWTDDGRVRRANSRFLAMLGYTREELPTLNYNDFTPADYLAETLDRRRALTEHGASIGSFDKDYLRKDGSRLPVVVGAARLDEHGEEYVAYVLDNTGHRDALAAQRLEEERYRSLVVASAQVVWTVDARGKMFSAENASWLAYTGQTEEELDRKPSEAIHPEDRVLTVAAWRKALATETLFEAEYRLRRPDGSHTLTLARSVPVRNLDGTVREWVGTNTDISEKRAAEIALHQLNLELEARVERRTAELSSANAELEAFSYSVSHDLRAPLRAVDGFAQALEEDFGAPLPDEARDYLRRIRAGSQRMGQLIDDLLSLSRVGRTELSRGLLDVSQLATSVAEELREREPERTLSCTVTPGLHAHADARLLRIVFENLLGNAWKFTRKNESSRIEVGMLEDGTQTFFVRDNGAGFDMAYASKLFGAFQRLHRASEFPGTGVGLATVQRIVRRHGGHVWADAKPDEGATFFFTLRTASA